jgi:hypothetical protein
MEHSTSEHTTASNGSSADNPAYRSMVSLLTVTGTDASSAARRASTARRCSGSMATTSVTVAG